MNQADIIMGFNGVYSNGIFWIYNRSLMRISWDNGDLMVI